MSAKAALAAKRTFLRASELLVSRGWCKRAYAIDGAGREVPPHSPAAVAFCLLGAVRRAADELQLDPTPATERLNWSAVERHIGLVPYWQDAPERTRDDALWLLRQAVADADEEAERAGP